MTPSARLKSAGLASGLAGTIVLSHPLDAPFGPTVTASLPTMNPGKKGFPPLVGPP